MLQTATVAGGGGRGRSSHGTVGGILILRFSDASGPVLVLRAQEKKVTVRDGELYAKGSTKAVRIMRLYSFFYPIIAVRNGKEPAIICRVCQMGDATPFFLFLFFLICFLRFPSGGMYDLRTHIKNIFACFSGDGKVRSIILIFLDL